MREPKKSLRARLTELRGKVDPRDVLCFGGIGLAAAGVWQIYPPAAWIVSGAALFWLAVRR